MRDEDLILIRGIPGAGKTTLAKEIAAMFSYTHLEAAQFHTIGGQYLWDAKLAQMAHEVTLLQTRRALAAGQRVVVANTFTRLWEMEPYLNLKAPRTAVIRCENRWQNSYGVPSAVISAMADRFEDYPGEEIYKLEEV